MVNFSKAHALAAAQECDATGAESKFGCWYQNLFCNIKLQAIVREAQKYAFAPVRLLLQKL